MGPVVVCDQAMPHEVGPDGSPIPFAGALTCEAAVAAARRAVGSVTGVVTIEFGYGFYCPPGTFCVLALPNEGHVLFHRRGQASDLVVDVRSDAAGRLTAFSPKAVPAPSPS